MKAILCRKYRETQTEGELKIYEEELGELLFSCKTLELPYRDNERNVSCIPEGVYRVVYRYSKKYKHHLHITGVDGRSLILIHHGNYVGSPNPKTGLPDIRGCVLVGKDHVDITGDGIKEVTSSKVTMRKLMEIAPKGFTLKVTQ